MVQKEVTIEPMSRIEGHLGVQATADDESKVYTDAHSFGTMFRGWEVILKGREPADAIWITQRTCGVCPVPHGIAASIAVDMAYQAPPPPMGIALRNLILGAEQLYDAALGCYILEGPDYSQAIVERSNPDWWEAAKSTPAPRADLHGYATIADIMTGLNPISGSLWLRSLGVEKIGRKMAALLGAKHPHVNTLVPGGVAKTLTPTDLEQYAAMLSQNVAFAKEFIPTFDDLLDFVLSMGYEECGARANNMISYGAYEDPLAYNAKYEDMADWSKKRRVSPGVIIDGELVTQDMIEVNVGVQEMVERSYYEDWEGPKIGKDPLGNPLTKYHPWNKETKPKPGAYKDWDGKYSWGSSVRWLDWKNGGEIRTVELGPIARMWATAIGNLVPESTGSSIKFALPKATVVGYRNADEMDFEWKVPEKVNTVERVRARAYYYAYSAYIIYSQVLQGLELVKAGNVKVWNKYKKAKDGLGVGMLEAMRGGVAHWVVMKNSHIENYQIMAPSTWNAGPRLGERDYGPYEDAIVGSPLTESGEITGVDVVRTIRSFDPCLACCVQVYRGDERIVHIPEI
ncbi:Ni,Fe-hydrogenase I large subunit [Thaumarchaeota archaeon SCGC AB-539-E09]|nr:Ni,Fe-hydrogenase I large subunit [Thaumarchaeota archaeon SCGC AB-539-E09]